MRACITASLLAILGIACEPEQMPDEPEPPGVLEYEHRYIRLYRVDRRIDAVLVEGDVERRECGILSERAYTELTDTLAALDPGADYGYDPDVQDCMWGPGAEVHVEGFEHSPFACDFQCCQPELARAGLIYFLVEYHFLGEVLEVDGEPYVAIEPDQPCP